MRKISDLLMAGIMALVAGTLIGTFIVDITGYVNGTYNVIYYDVIILMFGIIVGLISMIYIYIKRFLEEEA